MLEENILTIAERHRHMHCISRNSVDFKLHEARITFEKQAHNDAALAGSLLDFWISTQESERAMKYRLLANCAPRLPDNWLLLLYDALEQTIDQYTPVPSSRWSILTEDVTGHFDFIQIPKMIYSDYLIEYIE